MALIIPDLFSPYIQGREAAIQANWNDEQQFNAGLRGRINNLENILTLPAEVNRAYETLDALALQNLFTQDTYENRLARDNMSTLQSQYATNSQYYNDQLNNVAFPGIIAEQGNISRQRQAGTVAGIAANPVQPNLTGTTPQTPSGIPTFSAPATPSNSTPATSQQTTQNQQVEATRRALEELANQGITPTPRASVPVPNAQGGGLFSEYTPGVNAGTVIQAPTFFNDVPVYNYETPEQRASRVNAQHVERQTGMTIADTSRTPIVNNPTNPVQYMPAPDLTRFGITESQITGLQNGQSFRVPNGNYFIYRDDNGRLWSVYMDPATGNLTERIPIAEQATVRQQ